MKRRLLIVLLLLAGATVAAEFATSQLFYYRDNFSTHLPAKVLSAEMMRSGVFPLWNDAVGGGQPMAANPNTLTFYPDTLLYLFLPPFVAFNLHFIIHWLGGFLAMRLLARREGCHEHAAFWTAVLYSLGGVALSCFAFYNLIAWITLFPLGLLVLRELLTAPSVSKGLIFGAVTGLMILVGEPVTFLSFLVVAVLMHASLVRKASIRPTLLAGGVALLVASPLLLAYQEVAGELERAQVRFSTTTTLAASLDPRRIAELFLGPIHGLATDLSATGFMATTGARWPPLFLSVTISVLLLPALLHALRHQRRLALLFALPLLIALGNFNPLMVQIADGWEWARFLRYPEKFVMPLAVIGALLIGKWLSDRYVAAMERKYLVASMVLLMAIAMAAVMATPSIAFHTFAAASTGLVILLLAAQRQRSHRIFHISMFAATLQLLFVANLNLVDEAEPYRRPPILAQGIGSGRVLHNIATASRRLRSPDATLAYRVAAESLDPAFGTVHGIRYVLDQSPDGMYALFSRLAAERAGMLGTSLKVRYARIHGASYLIDDQALSDDSLRPGQRLNINGSDVFVHRVLNPLPEVRSVRRVRPASTIQGTAAVMEQLNFDPAEEIVAPVHGGSYEAPEVLKVLATVPGRYDLQVEGSSASVLVVNQTFFRAWKVRGSAGDIRIFPCNFDRLALLVPGGQHRFTLEFGIRPRLIQSAAAVSLLLLSLALAVCIRSKYATASPAR